MQAVSVTEFTTHLSRYLAAAEGGDEVVVENEEGCPVARLVPAPGARRREPEQAPTVETGDADLDRLIARGVVTPGRGDPGRILDLEPLKLPAGLLEVLLEDREDRT